MNGYRMMIHSSQKYYFSRLDNYFILALILSVPSVPYIRYGLGDFEIPIALVIIGLYSCAKTWLLLDNSEPLEISRVISALMIILFLWSTASLFWASSPDFAFRRLISRCYQTFFVLLALNCCYLGATSAFGFSRLLPLVILVPVAIGFFGFFTVPEAEHFQFSYEFPRRLGDRNSDTFMVLTAWPLALAMMLGGNQGLSWRTLGLVTSVLIGGALFFSLSRANLLSAIAICVIMITLNSLIKKTTKVALLGTVLIFVATLTLGGAILTQHFNQTLDQWETRFAKVDDNQRWAFNQGAWELAARHPLTGVGLNNFRVQFPTTHAGRQAEHDYNPHNSFLGTWSELGFPGLIVFTCVVLWPLFYYIKLFLPVMRFGDQRLAQIYIGGFGLSIVLILSILAYNFAEDFYYWIAYVIASLMALTVERGLRSKLITA
jgi:O-antigen ligase